MNKELDQPYPVSSHGAAGLQRWAKKNRLFLYSVALPTALSAAYFGLIASDVYISESKFIVRSSEQQSASPLGMIFKGSGLSRSDDDSYTVQNFILSRDALRTLDDSIGIKKAFSSDRVDVFNRFGSLGRDNSDEEFFKYYQKTVDVQLDSSSPVISLITRAFDAHDSVRMNQMLLDVSEALVNRLNERARKDMIDFAVREVAEAEIKQKETAVALAAFRNKSGLLDPEKQSQIPLQHIAKMQEELIATKTQLAQLSALAKNNPQIQSLQIQARSLEQQIALERTNITGSAHSIASKASDYQRLAQDAEFAGKMLGSAMSALEEARNQALRKQLYLERISEPKLPDHAMEPRRLRNVLATLLVGLIVWGILSILVAGVKEHHDR